jgi:hypothetical protein
MEETTGSYFVEIWKVFLTARSLGNYHSQKLILKCLQDPLPKGSGNLHTPLPSYNGRIWRYNLVFPTSIMPSIVIGRCHATCRSLLGYRALAVAHGELDTFLIPSFSC